MKKNKTISLLIIFLFLFLSFSILLNVEVKGSLWYNTSWKYSKKITIDHTKVTGTLSYIPILFINTSSSFSHAQNDGDDFIFMNYDNTSRYNHEIENFTSNRLIAWVNITSLSSTTDTIIYLYYGNPSCSNQQNYTKVWTGKYLTVYHMNDTATTGYIHESTSNNNIGIKGGSLAKSTSGKIGDCQNFDGINDIVNSTNTIALGKGVWTFEAWVKSSGYGLYDGTYGILGAICPSTANPYMMVDIRTVSSKSRFRSYMDNAGTHGYSYTNSLPTTFSNTWIHVVVVKNNTATAKFMIYVNGSADYTIISNVDTAWTLTTYYLTLGCSGHNYPYTSGVNHLTCLKGQLDEVRLSNVVLTNTWISTEYNNQNSPSTFLSVGIERICNYFPVNSSPIPSNNSIIISQPILTITINDSNADLMNQTFRSNYTGTWKTYQWTNNTLNTTVTINSIVFNKNVSSYWSSNLTDNKSGWSNNTYYFYLVRVPSNNLTVYNNTLNVTGKYQTSYSFLNGNKIWMNYTGYKTSLTVYNNTVNVTGKYQTSYNSLLGNKIWLNFTGIKTSCGNTSLTVYNNTVNVTGKYQTSYNSTTGNKIWLNFTGLGGGNITGYVEEDLFITGYTTFILSITGFLMLKRRKKQI